MHPRMHLRLAGYWALERRQGEELAGEANAEFVLELEE
jgi:hypothetical protein